MSEVERWYQNGLRWHHFGELERAKECYRQALLLDPNYAQALHLLGVLSEQNGDNVLAAELISRAVKLEPGNALVHFNLGKVLKNLGRLEAALQSYNQAIVLSPAYADAYTNRGNVWRALQRPKDALTDYETAISLSPNDALTYNNFGTCLQELGRYESAIRSYKRAITLKDNYVDAYYNLGVALNEIRQYDAALRYFERAMSLDPSFPFLLGEYLHSKMRICDWSNLKSLVDLLAETIGHGARASAPFFVLGLLDSASTQKMAADTFSQDLNGNRNHLPPIEKYAGHTKIRLAYYSADFHDHATAFLISEMFEKHDRNRFETYAFSFGRHDEGETRKRLTSAFDCFFDVRGRSDKEIAQLSRDYEIDIAVDLKGYTKDCRAGIFSFRAAPIQVSYLGYPGTTGTKNIDYLIADNVLIPENYRSFYSEKVAYLPNSYQCNDSHRTIASNEFTREEMGLPKEGFVFCSFNSSYKITPEVFSLWMTILNGVADSVLWIYEENPIAAKNLIRAAADQKVDPKRIVFAKKMPLAEHLARHHLADLFLDTFPCNAHTTASDALWAGLPLITRKGESFASRVAASLLTALGLTELITSNATNYEKLAIELATRPEQLRAIRQKLATHRLSSPLFDAKIFTSHIEAAFTEMYRRHNGGLPPDTIKIFADTGIS